MKILITESQLDKVIDKYISSQIGKPLKEKTARDFPKTMRFWVNKQNRIIFNYTPHSGFLDVDNELFEEVMNTFGKSFRETEVYFYRWDQKNLNLNDTLFDVRSTGGKNFLINGEYVTQW